MNMFQRFAQWLAKEPAVLAYAVSGGVTVWVAFGFRAPAHDVAAVQMIGAAIVTIITAFTTRPVSVPVVTGGLTEIATAAGAFGVHLTAAQIGALAPVVLIVVSLLLRQAITPVVSLRKRPAINLMKKEAS
jgi:hypothetical protein